MKTHAEAPAKTGGLTSGQRRYLYGTAAVTGGAVMIVEILGAKMLAPYFGTSHFVWTAQIAITLVALALGYYGGGIWADKRPDPSRIYKGILVAGLYLCAAVLAVRPVSYWCLRFELAIGSLLASFFLYFIPLFLLAMVGPYFVRVLTESVSGVGGNVGRLTAIGTAGSFVGTLLIGYVLIPFLPNSATMLLTAGALFAVSAGHFVLYARSKPAVPALMILAGIGLGLFAWKDSQRSQFTHVKELARANSDFGLLQVVEQIDSSKRYYLNDYLTQNTYDVEEKKSTSLFTYMLHGLAKAYTPEIRDVLCIGLGVGIVPMDFAREGAKVDVVEINPAVVPLAEQFFGLEPKRLNIHIGDGRYYLNQTTGRYDTVILDAFLGDSSPSHLMTQEAFEAIRRVLKPKGTLVINSFGDFSQGNDFFTASLFKTLTNVFAGVRIHAEWDQGNIMFVASDHADLEIVHPPTFDHVYAGCAAAVKEAFSNLREPDPRHGRVLTDDFNPVEFYDASNRQRIRHSLALSAKSM